VPLRGHSTSLRGFSHKNNVKNGLLIPKNLCGVDLDSKNSEIMPKNLKCPKIEFARKNVLCHISKSIKVHPMIYIPLES
jgi:hypothetical protein